MEPRRDSDVLRQLLDLSGKRVVDIGCGDGALARIMTRAGASVIGIEPQAERVKKSQAAQPAGKEAYIVAGGETLPLDDESRDVAVFFNSLHHIPLQQQASALAEAGRILAVGGVVYVAEPVAAGSNFEMTRAVDDETHVRAHALGVVHAAPWIGLEQVSEITYEVHLLRTNFADFRARHIAVDPARATAIDRLEAQLRRRFEELERKTNDGYVFVQPMRVNLLRKP